MCVKNWMHTNEDIEPPTDGGSRCGAICKTKKKPKKRQVRLRRETLIVRERERRRKRKRDKSVALSAANAEPCTFVSVELFATHNPLTIGFLFFRLCFQSSLHAGNSLAHCRFLKLEQVTKRSRRKKGKRKTNQRQKRVRQNKCICVSVGGEPRSERVNVVNEMQVNECTPPKT